MRKDSKRFTDSGGWGYALFDYDPASDGFTPHGTGELLTQDGTHLPGREDGQKGRNPGVRGKRGPLAGIELRDGIERHVRLVS